ncbi:hypothetical protein CROQUDRAFT_38451 [Cronartium quercuum f. sp. fusiforme G11]|uniref:Nucleolar protein 9 n=1 Tax=Cronartium quercuum f. sp. fusiforme G11 TaxID=708437 RepID=A0A9P6NTX4_9BASI|nr:hypothetical protein CROQUDRAFT_38451 [Cronartium quercuum f. sp. fusiforme G11]
MPREFRKRGRGNRAKQVKKQDDICAAPAEPPTYQNVLDMALPEESGHCHEAEQNNAPQSDHQSLFPEPSPDLKAYWREIDDKIQELERLGAGATQRSNLCELGEDEGEDDERHLLLRSALEELSGHELSLAADPETSIILERLIHSMDDFAKRVLADRFIGHFLALSSHRHASHVVQTLLVLSAPVLAREAQGTTEEPNNGVDHDQSGLPPLHLLLAQACEDMMSDLSSLLKDASATHVLLALFLVVSGKPVTTEDRRSRKSTKWRSKQGQLRSVFHRDQNEAKIHGDALSPVPVPLRKMGDKLYDTIREKWCHSAGAGTRNAACDPIASGLLQVLIDLEFDKDQAEQSGSMVDHLLDGLFLCEASQARSEFVETCLRDVTASHALEVIITRLSPARFSQFYKIYFFHRTGQLSNHPVTNFLTAKVISRLQPEQFMPALLECSPKMVDCIDNYRTAAMQAFINRSKEFGEAEQREVMQSVLRAFGVSEETEKMYTFPCLVSLMRLEYFRKTAAFQHLANSPDASESETTGLRLPDSNIQGSLLLQGILQLAVPDLLTSIVNGLLALPLSVTICLSRDPIASRALDIILESSTVPPISRRQFITRFIGHYHRLADDRVGSRVAELCWAVADVYTKEKIATSLTSQQNVLQQSAYGHYFIRKLELPFFERQRDAWKVTMLGKFPPRKNVAIVGSEHRQSIIPTSKESEQLKAGLPPSIDAIVSLVKASKPKRKRQKEPEPDPADELDDLFSPIIKNTKKKSKKDESSIDHPDR